MPGSPKKHRPNEYTVRDFDQEFPDDDACLEYLWRQLHAPDGATADCPKCGKPRRFHRVKARQSYSCDTCGHHLHPTANTIFEKSTTPLRLWFHAIFLLSQTRCGISAKQLQRELGVTYKTAWRMFNRIRRLLLEDDDAPLTGAVEVDETSFGLKGWTSRPLAGTIRSEGVGIEPIGLPASSGLTRMHRTPHGERLPLCGGRGTLRPFPLPLDQ
jgi:transposase